MTALNVAKLMVRMAQIAVTEEMAVLQQDLEVRANGANGQNGDVAVDVGSDANGRRLNGGNTNGMSGGSNRNYVIIEYSV